MSVVLSLIMLAFVIAFVTGVVLRIWTVTLEPVMMAEVTPRYAAEIVSSLLEGVSETRFGFPSGVFRFNAERSLEDSRITVQEMQPGYSVTDGCAAASTVAGAGIMAEADGCFELIIAGFLFVLVVGPIWVLNLTEKMFRKLLESEVRANLEPVMDPDGTLVTVRLRGVSALLLKRPYEEALSPPKLPEDIAVAAGVKPPPQASTTEV